jgi:hypothetical protein
MSSTNKECLHCKLDMTFYQSEYSTVIWHNRPKGAKRKDWIRGYLCQNCESTYFDYTAGRL